jgi:hypothetical protein
MIVAGDRQSLEQHVRGDLSAQTQSRIAIRQPFEAELAAVL